MLLFSTKNIFQVYRVISIVGHLFKQPLGLWRSLARRFAFGRPDFSGRRCAWRNS